MRDMRRDLTMHSRRFKCALPTGADLGVVKQVTRLR